MMSAHCYLLRYYLKKFGLVKIFDLLPILDRWNIKFG
jgi:hypothetical protein